MLGISYCVIPAGADSAQPPRRFPRGSITVKAKAEEADTAMNVAKIVAELKLAPHPEGGYFRETYRAAERIARDALPRRFSGERSASTAIYFLLETGQCSRLHRIRSDEVWHFYAGDPLIVVEIDPGGRLKTTRLGGDLVEGAVYQHVVPAGA